MLHEELIVKGPEINYDIPVGWQMGKYMIDCIKKREPDEIFCVDGITNDYLTCSSFVEQALNCAHILRTLDVKPGDVVALISENTIKYVAPLISIFYIGAASVLLNPIYTTGELKRALIITKPKVIICSKTALKNVSILHKELDFIKKVLLLENVSQPIDDEYSEVENLETLLEKSTINTDTVEPAQLESGNQTALILLSSGTTGLPKCVLISHDNCRPTACCFGDPKFVGIGPGDSTIAVLPFFHIFGASTILAAAVHSMKLVVLPAFQPEVYLKCVQIHRITLLFSVPPMVSFLVKHPIVKRFDLSSIKWIFCSGGCLGAEVQDDFTKIFPDISIRQLYGLTEMAGACTISRSFDTTRVGSVGLLIASVEAMVWDNKLSENLGRLKTGELCFRGPSVMKGYIERENNDIDEYGFYHTGDLGYYDDDGHFYIAGRIKELIKYKGFQVAPAEIEDLVAKHPSVAECGVIGIPDDRAGQLATAVVVLQKDANATEEDIIEFVAERISVHKHLHGGVKFTNSIPRNAAGKILRNQLFELYKTI